MSAFWHPHSCTPIWYPHSGTPRLVKEKEELKDWLARQKKIHQVFVIIFLMAMVIFLMAMVIFLVAKMIFLMAMVMLLVVRMILCSYSYKHDDFGIESQICPF